MRNAVIAKLDLNQVGQLLNLPKGQRVTRVETPMEDSYVRFLIEGGNLAEVGGEIPTIFPTFIVSQTAQVRW